MISTLRNFFAFCTRQNRNKFYQSLVWGVVIAFCEAMKFPAIGLTLRGFLTQGEGNMRDILTGFLILVISLGVECFVRAISTMLQCEAGYQECANKRI